ncbi:MAG: ATP-binding protein [Polyangiaceae bacterium]
MDDRKSGPPADGALLRAEAHEPSEAEAFLDAVFEHLPHMVFVKDAERLSFIRFNRAGEELLGMPRSALLGKTDHDFWPPEQVQHFVRKDRETLAGGKLVEIDEEPIQTARGQRWLRTKKIPLLDKAGVPRFLLGISEDITDKKQLYEELLRTRAELEERVLARTAQLSQEIADRKQAEEALQKSQDQLRQAHKMEAVGVLAGGVAHDFNNLLTVISGYAAALLNDGETSSAVREDVSQINKAAEQAAMLTRQLLAFSRRQVLKPEVLDLNVIISDLGMMLRRLIGEDIQLSVCLSARPALVKADPGQIEQVILNLVVNARDALENGGQISIESAHVEVTESGRGAGRRSVMLSVGDTGLGMNEETRARVFEPFFTTKERGRGTGLGLATVYGIVQQSGGTISVHSEPGFGSTFKVYLPVTHEAPSVQASPADSEFPASHSISVLLVEDEELVRSVARRVLQQHGMRVVEADCPAKALAIFRQRPDDFEVVVSDVVMPGMNGPAMVEALLLLKPGLKVLFMSGYTNDALVHQAVVERGFVFLQKPFVPKELVRRVQELAAAAAAGTR